MPLENLVPAFDFTESMIAGIDVDHWSASTQCDDWDLRRLVNHVIGGQIGMSAGAAGTSPAPDFFERDYADDDPAGRYRAAADDAIAAWPDALDKVVRFGPLELPGTVGAPLNFVEALVHGIDIAVASGQKIALSDGLAEHALTAAHQVVQDDFRSGGAFGAERVVDDDAEPIERLLGFLGRPTLDG